MNTPKKLIRESGFIPAYEEWKLGKGRNSSIRRVREFFDKFMLGESSWDCDIIQTPTYAMLILHHMDDWDEDDYRYLMDFWRERILGEGYIAYMSDSRVEVLDGGIRQRIERHYLKPNVFDAIRLGLPVDRKYGNLTLELVFLGEEVDYMKMTMGFYHERAKRGQMGLERLMEVLLKG
ncbi:MAG: hypothetical protein GC180_02875 [Bacteroidetes bacterium]|nr:hypothetical protein [Bacteroidota bacterium]